MKRRAGRELLSVIRMIRPVTFEPEGARTPQPLKRSISRERRGHKPTESADADDEADAYGTLLDAYGA